MVTAALSALQPLTAGRRSRLIVQRAGAAGSIGDRKAHDLYAYAGAKDSYHRHDVGLQKKLIKDCYPGANWPVGSTP